MIIGLATLLLILIISFTAYIIKSQHQLAKLKAKISSNDAILQKALENDKQSHLTLQTLEDKLSQAIQDPVTHLLGRELFEDRLKQSINESDRYHLTEAVLFIDINEFNKINLALGYEAGDIFLTEVAKRLETCIRKVDTLARFNKDIFVCLLTQLGKPEAAAIVAQRMLQAIGETFSIQGQELNVTASLGIAIYPADGEDAATLLRHAEYALKLAKDKGKQSYQFYQERTQLNSQRELILSTSFSNERVLREFSIYYQPIINTQDETIFCMDTLLSWENATIGRIDAHELFNYAEKQRKLNLLTECTLKKACRSFMRWRSFGFSPKFLGISLSIRQLEVSQFIPHVSQILHELQFNPKWLLLSIGFTQKDVQLSFDVLEKAFNMLNYLGVKIAIDYFGVSPFLLSYLKIINVNYLKIDPSITDDVLTNQKALALVKSFHYLAESTSMELIAAGVQSSQQKKLLKELGCSLMQGQFFSPPLSEQEVSQQMVERLS